MKRASVGIAAALMLATLVIAVVPVFGVVRLRFADETGTWNLLVSPDSHGFFLWRSGEQLPLCHGVGAYVVGKALSIRHGECVVSTVGASFLTGGGKVSTGPIRLALVTVGVPPTEPLILVLWPSV